MFRPLFRAITKIYTFYILQTIYLPHLMQLILNIITHWKPTRDLVAGFMNSTFTLLYLVASLNQLTRDMMAENRGRNMLSYDKY
jgi:hypothetical protein